jgi:hypothetical protein
MSVGSGIDNLLDNVREYGGEAVKYGMLGTTFLIGSALIVSAPILLGAGIGELFDNMPYFRQAIPKGIELIADSLSSHESHISEHLSGNLDKVGASIGFVSNIFSLGKSLDYISNINKRYFHRS